MALHQTRTLLLARRATVGALTRPLGAIKLVPPTISAPSSDTITSSPPRDSPVPSVKPLTVPPPTTARHYPLAGLSTGSLLRAVFLYSVTASPSLYKLGTKLIMMSLDSLKKKGGLLKWGVDKTFYAQYCAGSTSTEIAATVNELRSLGLAGVILVYARETVITDSVVPSDTQSQQIKQWLNGSLRTIAYIEPGDYVALKYSGAGLSSLPLLNQHKPCSEFPELADALLNICDTAKAKGVRILVDAEQASIQDGVHGWSLNLMRRYNTGGKAVVFNTYQMYLKASPEILCRHMETARKGGFTLGVKLVRGAYMQTDPRHLIHSTKEDTDNAYDDAIRWLLTGSPTSGPERASFFDVPVAHHLTTYKGKVDLVVASHNRESVELALALRRQLGLNSRVGELAYAQLMGMADELSLSLLSEKPDDEEVKVYKYAVWGTTQECVKYLVRRAEENKDAVGRTTENRTACMKEIWRRVRFANA